MTATRLIREALQPLYEKAENAHPGLLLQRGFPEHRTGEDGSRAKTEHIARVCKTAPGEFYGNAYRRWRAATSDKQRFRQVSLQLESRLFVGLTGGGMLETGCAIARSYGAPSIPGSSIKGAVAAFARERLDEQNDGKAICVELFGAPASEENPTGLSGLIIFHDAWWAPNPAKTPLAQDVVTSHHPDYYGRDGATPATDYDSPVPNAQVAAQGEFLFVIEGPAEWLDLAENMLADALVDHGLGAKTRSGYGRFRKPDPHAARRSAWVDETIDRLVKKNNAKQDDILRGKGLAEAFRALDDSASKKEAFEDVRARWRQKGWWDGSSPGRAAKAARKIYDEYADAARTDSD